MRCAVFLLVLLAAGPALAENSNSPRCVRDLPRSGELLFRADAAEANSRTAARPARCDALRESQANMSQALSLIRGCMNARERAEGGNYEHLLGRQRALRATFASECARKS